MSQVKPTFESVFTPEYWGDVVDVSRPGSNRWPQGQSILELNPLLAQAARHIFTGSQGHFVETGKVISPTGNEFYNQPGSILFADFEALIGIKGLIRQKLNKSSYNGDRDLELNTEELRERTQIRDDQELQASPKTLFIKNAAPYKILDQAPGFDVWPYNKYILNPSGTMKYGRFVCLLAIAPDVNNNSNIYSFHRWGHELDDEPIHGTTRIFESPINRVPINLTVRETLELEETKRSSGGVIRLKYAELCTRGVLSEVKQKVKAKKANALVPAIRHF